MTEVLGEGTKVLEEETEALGEETEVLDKETKVLDEEIEVLLVGIKVQREKTEALGEETGALETEGTELLEEKGETIEVKIGVPEGMKEVLEGGTEVLEDEVLNIVDPQIKGETKKECTLEDRQSQFLLVSIFCRINKIFTNKLT